MNHPRPLSQWVLNPPPPRPDDESITTNPNVAFGHFQGRPAMNKSRRLPEALWDSVVSGGRSTISIVHVVDRSKLWRLSRQRADHVSEETARGVIPITTVDYKGLVRELKTSRRNGRWHLRPRGPPAPKAFFLIEVDPDGSADFFLALYAAVEFSLSVTEDQTQAAIRLATMSWEDILNSQLAGLIAGLAQFEGWPSRIRSLSRLIALLAQDDEIGTLTEEQADGLHWDCLRAFAFQIAVLTFPRDPRIPVVHDIVSGVELLVNIALLTVDFDTIKENDPECMVGFYTTLSRPRNAPGTMISDWNWIPSSVWKRWRRSLEADGSDRWALLANRYMLGRNSDEAKRDRGRKPGNKKKLQVKPNAFCFVEANKPEPLEASIANQDKPSFAVTVGTSYGSKLGPLKGIEDSIWAAAGIASKAVVKPAAPRPQPVAPQAMETIPKDAFCLSEIVKALPPLKPFGQGQVEPVNGFQHQGRFYPKSPKQPDRVHREKMWRLAFPGLPWADGGEPFRIELSEQMDFGFLVWGLNGTHLVDPSLNPSWGYKDPIPQKATEVLCQFPLGSVAKVARVLDLGFMNDRSTGNLDRIKDLWSSLSAWSKGIRNEANKGLAMKGAGDLVSHWDPTNNLLANI
ncbi:hypothetical protein CEP52_010235 [Fusarium oligoseptatum]|uniref:Uncharacterized protein n=1 Tax=Fusarium oligoseptatum TaxID=2604345 RepID=A0A428T9G7_9HYPO|nr:hypothetical protein CEP52_010235 [Fusarium oligoseptatum]